MTYQHGVYVTERETSLVAPLTGTAGLQVIVGTAPVNMAENPYDCTNKPVIAYSYAEAVANVGYSDNWKDFTICQSIYASFQVLNVAPIIMINVLDPVKHVKALSETTISVASGQAFLNEQGVLLDTLTIKNGGTALEAGKDYTAAFDDDGNVVITMIATAETLTVSGKAIDPSKVEADDIVGGYNVATGLETGLEVIRQVYPKFAMTPGLLVAPGWSHIPTVAAALQAKCTGINDVFTCECICDIDSTAEGATKYTDVKEKKEKTGLDSIHCLPVWPCAKVGDKVFWGSAIAAALTAYTDAQNDDIPNLSPSNKSCHLTGTCLADGTEIVLDQSRANLLNSYGVTTFVSMDGFKLWGGRTAAYPTNTDPKDMWFSCRRFFSWRENGFIRTYIQKVDKNADVRLIQTICDSENIVGNGYVAKGYCAGDRITFDMSENPATDILNGTIQFHHYLAPWTPAHVIKNTFEFDVNALMSALAGGAE